MTDLRAAQLILKRPPIGWNQDYDALENASSSVASSRCRSRRRTAHGCGRAGITVTYAAPPTAASRRARPRWRRSPRGGGGRPADWLWRRWWSVFDASQCEVRRNEACFTTSIGERTKAAGTSKEEETMIKILGLLVLIFLIVVLARTKQENKTAPFPPRADRLQNRSVTS
jgi:hypothetical protein